MTTSDHEFDQLGVQLIARLAQAGILADYRRIEEMLWLSRLLPASPASTLGAEGEIPAEAQKSDPITMVSPDKEPQPLPSPDEGKPPAEVEPEETFYGDGKLVQIGETPASRVRIPSPAALPNSLELMRALSPLRKRVSSKTRFELDEEATVTRTAEQAILTPVYLPVAERWFAAALVVEHKASLAIWRQTIEEFQRMLERLGAFREICRLRLSVTEKKPFLVSCSGQTQSLETLVEPSGRRLVFLFTDGVSEAWKNGRMAQALAVWGNKQPVVIIQVQSEGMWHLTSLGKPTVKVKGQVLGATNRQFEIVRRWKSNSSGKELPVPLVLLYPASFGTWVQAILSGTSHTPAVMLAENPAMPKAVGTPANESRKLSPKELVSRFQYMASPTAFELAVFLSAVPLQIPIMRLVQKTMLPQSRLEHLSEFLLGGLVVRVDQNPLLEGDDIEFAFVGYDRGDEVRDLLQGEIRKSEMERLYQAVGEYIAERYGHPFDFFALVANPQGDLLVPPGALPFARIAERLLRRFSISPFIQRPNLPHPHEPELKNPTPNPYVGTSILWIDEKP